MLQGHTTYQARDLLGTTALAYTLDDNSKVTLYGEKDISNSTERARADCENDENPPYSRPAIYVPGQLLFHALELRDAYKPYTACAIARLELLSAQHTEGPVDASDKSMLAIPIGDPYAHFTVSGIVKLLPPPYIPSPLLLTNILQVGARQPHDRGQAFPALHNALYL
jgi:hypothetical protein